MKLVVDPAAGILNGAEFTVEVDYHGQPQVFTDPDDSIEGWIPACYPLSPPQTCDGAFVVNEPMGAQSWFPSNNYPTDKATFDTLITVPAAKTALGVGELAAKTDNGDGTDDLALERGRPDGDLSDDGDRRRLHLRRGLDGRDVDRPHASGLQRDRLRALPRRS